MVTSTSEQQTLDQLLERASSRYSGASLDALLAGIAGAPRHPGWTTLVAPRVDAPLERALHDQLEAVREVAGLASGLDQGRPPKARLNALRAELERRDLDGFVVPRVDEHMGEYVPPQAARLEWLTGFSGSAGAAIVTRTAGAIFVDGRYTLQVEQEADLSLFERRHLVEEPPARWVETQLQEGQRLGIDPWLHTIGSARRLGKACKRAGATLVTVDSNPIDAIWDGQPARPISPIRAHAVEHAGRTSADKRRAVAADLRARNIGAAVLTLPDSICWLLNIRGGDLPHNPMVLAMLLIHADEAGTCTLFVDPRKVTEDVTRHLGDEVAVAAPDALAEALAALTASDHKVLLDPASAPRWIADRLDAEQIVEDQDPTLLPKARKNEVELEGTREAHRRDGAAVSKFLAWLDQRAPRGGLTERDAADQLRAFREESDALLDLSFETISGAGPNGAIVHYRVSEESNRALNAGELYLVDSGGQYLDGTTDITRTVIVGVPTDEMRDRFTRVLKGHIALATARFPTGTTGAHLDILARTPLWEAGLDYDHGTGHGVGSYLCVHEGPHRISKSVNTVALEPGMIISNEPGYYKVGAYGIRIENLVVVREVETPEGGERDLLGFETITLAPIDRRLAVFEAVDLLQLVDVVDVGLHGLLGAQPLSLVPGVPFGPGPDVGEARLVGGHVARLALLEEPVKVQLHVGRLRGHGVRAGHRLVEFVL